MCSRYGVHVSVHQRERCDAEDAKGETRWRFELACARPRVAPAEAVFSDNLSECVEGARNAGLVAIYFIDTHQTVAELRSMLGNA